MIDIYGSPEEQAFAMIGMAGRNLQRLGAIAADAMGAREKLALAMIEPKALADGSAAYRQIEQVIDVATLERRYCSATKRSCWRATAERG